MRYDILSFVNYNKKDCQWNLGILFIRNFSCFPLYLPHSLILILV